MRKIRLLALGDAFDKALIGRPLMSRLRVDVAPHLNEAQEQRHDRGFSDAFPLGAGARGSLARALRQAAHAPPGAPPPCSQFSPFSPEYFWLPVFLLFYFFLCVLSWQATITSTPLQCHHAPLSPLYSSHFSPAGARCPVASRQAARLTPHRLLCAFSPCGPFFHTSIGFKSRSPATVW